MRALPSTFVGLFLITLSTLTYELLLTRIFSVTSWYHFAFLAISLAMLGMTVGAILVYLKSDYFNIPATFKHLSLSAVAFGIAGIVAVLVHIFCPEFIPSTSPDTIVLCSLLITAPFLLIVFAISGVCVSLALTRFPEDVNRLYAADLIGASLGCFGAVVSLRFVDGISAVFITASVAALAGLSFSLRADQATKKIALAASGLLIVFSLMLSYFSWQQTPLIAIGWTKGQRDVPVLLQKWNSFSRIRVIGDPNASSFPYGYFSDKLDRSLRTRQLFLDIDGSASTSLPFYDGNPATAKYLEFDPVNVAHFLRPHAKTLIIGIGGGRDVLSALVMGDKSIVGVEINPNIVAADEERFGDFTGHLNRDPRIKIVTDEARSYVAHASDHYDVILASVVDTWAASASGAYSMSENSLYTTDAWATLIKHLNKDGILTMCRFYDPTGPAEFYRLTALAAQALKQDGVSDPRSHIAIVRLIVGTPNDPHAEVAGIGAIIVGQSPLSEQDLDTLRQVCQEKKFELALTPTTTLDPLLARLASGEVEQVNELVPWNLAPPSDDNPFFFQTFSIRHLFDPRAYVAGRNRANLLAVPLLMVTCVAVLFATIYCFRIPFLRTKDKTQLEGAAPFFALFFLIGLAFMFVEISQIQRFTIFLGHPTYGATVVLSSLLAATGLGSLVLSRLWANTVKPVTFAAIVLSVLVLFGLSSHALMAHFAGESTPIRIVFAIAILFPVGMVLGTLFPASMKLANKQVPFLTPWLWGINGAASVLGSVLAVIAAICANITTSFWLGVLTYLCALLVYSKIRAR